MTSAKGPEAVFRVCAEAFDRGTPEFDRAGMRRRVLDALESPRVERGFGVRLWVVSVAVAASLAIGFGSWAFFRETTTFMMAGKRGYEGEWLAAKTDEPVALDFSEGTRVELAVGTRGRVSDLTRDGAAIEIQRGRARADVTHRTGSKWRFTAGPFEVTVVGTQLAVSWDPEAGKFDVTVDRGAVIVRGPLIQSAQEVHAGQACSVDLHGQSMKFREDAKLPLEPPALPVDPSQAPTIEQDDPAQGSTPETTKPQLVPSWSALAKNGKVSEAIALVEKVGLPEIYKSADANGLLYLSEVARRAGRPDIERDALLSCRNRFAGQSVAARAAYLLGKASSPTEATMWFKLYLQEQPSGLLAREAMGRLIESYRATGNRVAARATATKYLAAYPDGPHAAIAHQALE
jgi:FecR protein